MADPAQDEGSCSNQALNLSSALNRCEILFFSTLSISA